MTRGAGEPAAAPLARAAVVALSAYFVVVWGAGFVASRIALEYAAPFTYIGVRYGLAFCVAGVAFGLGARWPTTRANGATSPSPACSATPATSAAATTRSAGASRPA